MDVLGRDRLDPTHRAATNQFRTNVSGGQIESITRSLMLVSTANHEGWQYSWSANRVVWLPSDLRPVDASADAGLVRRTTGLMAEHAHGQDRDRGSSGDDSLGNNRGRFGAGRGNQDDGGLNAVDPTLASRKFGTDTQARKRGSSQCRISRRYPGGFRCDDGRFQLGHSLSLYGGRA